MRLGHHKCRTLLATSKHNLWNDTTVCMSPETGCLNCSIATICSSAQSKQLHIGAATPGKYVFLDTLHPLVSSGITPATSFPFYLILVDSYSRYTCIYGIPDKSTDAVVTTLKQYQANHIQAQAYGFPDTVCICTDAGSQLTSKEFRQYCKDNNIHLTLAAPKKQYQIHLAEWSWKTVSTMAWSLLVHARLPDTFWYHALKYTTYIFNVLPIHGLKGELDLPSTPYELFYNKKPNISRFRIFGCPAIICLWVATNNTNGKQMEHGIRGIFLGFNVNQKGYIIFAPGSRSILISDNVI
jgi:hypothetical protein